MRERLVFLLLQLYDRLEALGQLHTVIEDFGPYELTKFVHPIIGKNFLTLPDFAESLLIGIGAEEGGEFHSVGLVDHLLGLEIGRASCRERVCAYV